MACFHLPDRHNLAVLELKKLPQFNRLNPSGGLQPLVVHLKTILRNFGKGHPPAVQIPSVMALSLFYRCDILDLLECLRLLREARYDYLMKGLDLPLMLVDPLSRLRRSRVKLRKAARAIRDNQQNNAVVPNDSVSRIISGDRNRRKGEN
jgi:hypothetical protein